MEAHEKWSENSETLKLKMVYESLIFSISNCFSSTLKWLNTNLAALGNYYIYICWAAIAAAKESKNADMALLVDIYATFLNFNLKLVVQQLSRDHHQVTLT